MVTRQDLINLLIEVRPTLEDKKALQYMEMYPLWQSDLSVKVNERYQYNGRLYKVDRHIAHRQTGHLISRLLCGLSLISNTAVHLKTRYLLLPRWSTPRVNTTLRTELSIS